MRDNSKQDISTAEVKKIIDRLYELKIRSIAFFGGEPTLRSDFCEILEYSVQKGIFTYFTTNGTLLNEDYIERIAKTGVDYIELSVDSILEFSDSKKDFPRRRKTLDLLLKYQKQHKFSLKTHIVLTSKNLDTVVNTIKELNGTYRIPVTIGYISKPVNGKQAADESLFFNDEESKEKLVEVVDQIIELKRKGANIMDPYYYFEGMKKFVYGNRQWECKAGKYSFAVDYDGSVQLCTDLLPYKISVHEIDEIFFKEKKEEIEKTKKWCTKRCYSTCHNTTAYLIDHPVKTLIGK